MAKIYEVGLKLSAAVDPKLRDAFASAQESMRALGNGMKAMQDCLGNMDAWRKLNVGVKDTKQQFGLAKQEMERLRAQMSAADKPTKAMAHAFENAKSRVFELGDRLRSQRAELADVAAAMDKAGISTKNFGAEQQRLQEQMAKMGALRERIAANNAAIQANDARKAALKQKMLGPLAGFINPSMLGAYGVAQVIRRSANYEHALNQVQATGTFSDEQRKTLDQHFRYLGRTTEFTESDAAKLGLNFTRAGLTPQQILEASGATMNMATANSMGLDETSSILADQIKSWGYRTDQTARMASILTKSANSANMDVRLLAEAANYGAANAKSLGVTPEQFGAMIGAVSNRGIKGSMAGTGVNEFLARLAKPTKEVNEAFAQLGLRQSDFRDKNGNMRDVMSVIGMIAKKTEGMGNLDEVGALTGLAGKRGSRALIKLIEASRQGELKTLLDGIENSDKGTERYVDQAAAKMREGLTGAFARLSSAWEGFTHSLFSDDAGKGLAKTIDMIAEKLNALTDWLSKHQELVTFITTLATQFIALKMALGGAELIGRSVYGKWLLMKKIGLNLKAAYVMATSGVDALTAAQKKSSIVFKMWNFIANANPIGLVVTAVAALAAGAYYLYNHWEPFRKWWDGIWTAAKKKAAAVWEWLKGVPEKVLAKWQAVKDWFVGLIPANLGEKVAAAFSGLSDTVKEQFAAAKAWFAGLIPADLGEKVAGAFNSGIDAVKNWFSRIKDWIVEIPGQFVEMIKSLPSKIGEAFEAFGQWIRQKLKSFFTIDVSFGKAADAGVKAASQVDFSGDIPGSAAGRKTAGPMLSLIGEGAAPEYVIPTESRYRERALALWQQAGKDLGVPMMADGGITDGNSNNDVVGRFSYFDEEPRIPPSKVLSDLYSTHKEFFDAMVTSFSEFSQTLRQVNWIDYAKQKFGAGLNFMTMHLAKKILLGASAMMTPLGAANNDIFIKLSTGLASWGLNNGKSLFDSIMPFTRDKNNDESVRKSDNGKTVSFAPVFNITVSGLTNNTINEDIKRACREAWAEMKSELQRTSFQEYDIMTT